MISFTGLTHLFQTPKNITKPLWFSDIFRGGQRTGAIGTNGLRVKRVKLDKITLFQFI